jgi:transcriptional regulator with XRE-family HTH domain
MEIGNQIHMLRDSKKVSKEQMASWLDISINTYKKIEYGERIPSIEEIKIIAEKLEVDPSFFFSKAGNTFIQNGTNYPGVFGNGNIIAVDKSLLEAFTLAIVQNNVLIEKIGLLVEQITKK